MKTISLFTLLLAFCLSNTARGYDLMGIKWKASAMPVGYYVDLNSATEIGRDAALKVIKDSFSAWTSVSCVNASSSYKGETAGTANANDRRNVIFWNYRSWRYGSSAIGVTTPVYYQGGEIIDADIEFNGVNFRWTTSGGNYTTVDSQSIATHEVGHLWGLGHSQHSDATMYASYIGGTAARTLSSDDVAGICAIYPGGTGPDCTNDQQCGAGKKCEGGNCVEVSGTGRLGDNCQGTNDCAEGFCACMGDGCFCTRECNDQTNPCPPNYTCISVQGGGSACAPQQGGTGQLGDHCNSGNDCANGYCVTYNGTSYCSMPCDPLNSNCPANYGCVQVQQGGNACIPGAVTPTPRRLGDECSANEPCDEGFCSSVPGQATLVCTKLCEAHDQCPQGFYCGNLDAGWRGCLRGTAPQDPPIGKGDPPEYTEFRGAPGCSVSSGPAMGLNLFLALMLGWAFYRRRRKG